MMTLTDVRRGEDLDVVYGCSSYTITLMSPAIMFCCSDAYIHFCNIKGWGLCGKHVHISLDVVKICEILSFAKKNSCNLIPFDLFSITNE